MGFSVVQLWERFAGPLTFGHHAPFGDDGLAHLADIFGAGDFVNPERDFLADKALQLRRLGVAARDDLKRLGAGFEAAKAAGRRQSVRLTGELVGRHALAFLAAAATQGIEFSRQDITGLDQGARLVIGRGRRLILLRPRSRRRHHPCNDRAQSELPAESAFRHFNRFRLVEWI